MTLTTSLGRLVVDHLPNRPPGEAVRICRKCFSGSPVTVVPRCNEDVVRFLTGTFAPAADLATVTFGDRRNPRPETARITTDHVPDYDEDARNLTVWL